MANKEYWCQDAGSVTLVKEVLKPLIDIVMKYKSTALRYKLKHMGNLRNFLNIIGITSTPKQAT